MQVTFDIPDTLAADLTAAGQDPAHAAREALALEAYRIEQLNESEVRRMLGFGTRMQVHALLAKRGIPLNYTAEHLQLDIEASDKLHAQRTLQASTAA